MESTLHSAYLPVAVKSAPILFPLFLSFPPHTSSGTEAQGGGYRGWHNQPVASLEIKPELETSLFSWTRLVPWQTTPGFAALSEFQLQILNLSLEVAALLIPH